MKKIKYIFLVLLSSFLVVGAKGTNNFHFDISKMNTKSLADEVNNITGAKYTVDYEKQELSDEEKEIEKLTRKVTYIILGDENTEVTQDNYASRDKAIKDILYQAEVDDDLSFSELLQDENVMNNSIASFSVYSVFNYAVQHNMTYQKMGQPNIIKSGDEYIATIAVKNIEVDGYDDDNPMKVDRVTTNALMYYCFWKLDGKWKLYYSNVYFRDNIDDFFSDDLEKDTSSSKSLASDYSDVSSLFNFSKLKKISSNEFDTLYNKNVSKTVIINAYNHNNVLDNANGFYIRKGLIVTSWSFIKDALSNAQSISIFDNNNKVHNLDGVVYVNEDIDLAILKLKDEDGVTPTFKSSTSLKKEDPIFTISSKAGYNLKLTSGIYVSSKNDLLSNVLTLSKNDRGSAVFNTNSDIVGINTDKSVNSSLSNAYSIDVIINLQKELVKKNFKDIKAISFDSLKEKYYYNNNEEVIKNTLSKRVWNKYKKIGDLENTINLQLVKASYKNKTISLRYKNEFKDYMSGISLSTSFRNKLIKDKYKNTYSSDNKYIYENKDYKVIITDSFDYLIIVITEN